MKNNPYVYILAMAAVTFLIRVLPLTLIRKPIKHVTLRSCLYYVPYVTLAVMTFPPFWIPRKAPGPHWRRWRWPLRWRGGANPCSRFPCCAV